MSKEVVIESTFSNVCFIPCFILSAIENGKKKKNVIVLD